MILDDFIWVGIAVVIGYVAWIGIKWFETRYN